MLMRQSLPELQFAYKLPYGAIVSERGVQFVVFSRSATAMRLLLYSDVEDREPTEVYEFDRENDRWGDVWSIFIPGIRAGQLYHFQASGPFDPESGQWFDGNARLIDPYAKALAGCFQKSTDGVIRPPKCVVVDDFFDWEGDRHLRRPLSDSIIYEMHVRGFTKSKTAKITNPGTYLGVEDSVSAKPRNHGC
jgi:isoamylase